MRKLRLATLSAALTIGALAAAAPAGASSILLSRGSRTQFKNCSAAGIVFPYILAIKGNGRTLSAALPKRDLFDATERKLVLVGEGVDRHSRDASGTTYTTTVHWTIELKRVD